MGFKNKLNGYSRKLLHKRIARYILKRSHLEKLGSSYGGWTIPVDLLEEGDICYCVGVGEDITFDLELIRRFFCQIFAFDPTPRAVKYVEENTSEISEYHFFDIGLWSSDRKMKFYVPLNPSHVSHSIDNIQKTSNYFEAECKRLSTIMKDLNHDHLRLLKLDIEGAEYEVIESIIEDNLDIDIVCVEFHPPLKKIKPCIQRLTQWRYDLVDLDTGFNATFIKKTLISIS